MTDKIDAWILTIGNEIINAVISDTNREAVSRELRAAGVTVKGMSSVGDDMDLIADALGYAMRATLTSPLSREGLGRRKTTRPRKPSLRFSA